MDYLEFRDQYEKMHPASVPVYREPLDEYPRWLQPLCFIMFVCASLVSGVHTTTMIRSTFTAGLYPDVVLNGIAIAAFGALEIALFVTVFAWLRSYAKWIPYLSTIVVFMVIVVSNIADVAKNYSDNSPIPIFITIGVGVGIPLTALLSGKLFVDIFRSGKATKTKAIDQFRADQVAWDETIQRAWSRYQKPMKDAEAARAAAEIAKAEAARAEAEAASKRLSALSEQTDKRQTGYGYERNSSAVDAALEFLRQNPDAMNLSVRDLGEVAGVGKDSAAKARKLYSENGHSGQG